jgi:hypothetical protein
MSNRKAAHHMGAHQVTARRVVANANTRPDYRCPSCSLTRAEGIAKWGKGGEWQGGHIKHGDSSSGYHAQHAHCNASEGATYGNSKRIEPRTLRWR